MKRAWDFTQVVGGLVLLGILAVGLITMFQAARGGAPAPALQVTAQTTEGYPPLPEGTSVPRGYPLPSPGRTLSPPEMTAIRGTRIAEATAAAPAATSTPSPTFTPLPSGQICYVDPLNHFSLLLSPGWFADPPPSPDAIGGATVLYNYDTTDGEGIFPPGSLKIQITSDELDAGQSFDQWLSDLIAFYTSSAEPIPLTATEPTPYALGQYEGVSFVLMGQDYSSLEIVLSLNGGRVLIIGLLPSDSSALSEGLSMLSSLDASDTASCNLISGASYTNRISNS